MKSNKLFAAIVLVLASCAGNQAFAYRWMRCGPIREERLRWDSTTVRFRAAAADFPAGSAWRFALGEAGGLWNRTPTLFRYHITFDEPRVGRRNNQNEIYFSDSIDAPALTRFWYPRRAACQFKEADIVFNTRASATWGSLGPGLKGLFMAHFSGAAPAALRPFQGIALHELGHAQGLAHENRVYNIMGQEWDHVHANGSTAASYPGVDAVRGSMDTYGRLSPGLNQDLSVAHFKWAGTSGAYSMHRRTELFNTAGVPLADRGATEPRYVVRPGETIQVEFGYENLGVPSGRVMVSYHLSYDDTITTADPVIATRFIALEDSTYLPAESTRITLRLPTWLVPGSRYWIGAVIDPWNTVGEVDETNNASYIGIEVETP
jgi:hypothetical protein